MTQLQRFAEGSRLLLSHGAQDTERNASITHSLEDSFGIPTRLLHKNWCLFPVLDAGAIQASPLLKLSRTFETPDLSNVAPPREYKRGLLMSTFRTITM